LIFNDRKSRFAVNDLVRGLSRGQRAVNRNVDGTETIQRQIGDDPFPTIAGPMHDMITPSNAPFLECIDIPENPFPHLAPSPRDRLVIFDVVKRSQLLFRVNLLNEQGSDAFCLCCVWHGFGFCRREFRYLKNTKGFRYADELRRRLLQLRYEINKSSIGTSLGAAIQP
jgi:hypothetical protein